MSQEINNIKELKDNCFIQQADSNRYSLRLRIAGGNITPEHLKKVSAIAEKYGKGSIHLTSRQSIEIPFIKHEDIEAVKTELKDAGLRQGVCGRRIRTITACQGSRVCKSGLIDTSDIASEFDQLFYGKEVPHKFKIGITGCRNNCLKAEENDIGIKGAMRPEQIKDKCTYCMLCATKCPANCIKINKAEKELTIQENECILCGKCVKNCPVNAMKGNAGYSVYVGGLFGNSIQIGQQLIKFIDSRGELNNVVSMIIEFYKEHGEKGERFGKTLNRVGWERLYEYVNNNNNNNNNKNKK